MTERSRFAYVAPCPIHGTGTGWTTGLCGHSNDVPCCNLCGRALEVGDKPFPKSDVDAVIECCSEAGE